jgi:hypothetical protein
MLGVMASLAGASLDEIRALFAATKERLRGRGALDQAAQALVDELYERFSDSIVLARVFATVPFGLTPPPVQRFVSKLLSDRGLAALVGEETTVLALMGTRGALPGWNTRLGSRGHLGIPLASPELVEEIPMVSRLLVELGVQVQGVASKSGYITKVVGNLSGVFYVEDAGRARDDKGRPIIAAQDFVATHGVKTVFGFGGAYMLERSFAVIIVFAREAVSREQVQAVAGLASALKAATLSLVTEDRYFS